MAVDSAVHDVIVDELNQDTDNGTNDSELKERTTKNSSSSEVKDVDSALTESQQTNTKVKSGDQDSKDHTIQSPTHKDTGAFEGRVRGATLGHSTKMILLHVLTCTCCQKREFVSNLHCASLLPAAYFLCCSVIPNLNLIVKKDLVFEACVTSLQRNVVQCSSARVK